MEQEGPSAHSEVSLYRPYEGFILDNQNDRKLDEYDRKLEGRHSILGRFFFDFFF